MATSTTSNRIRISDGLSIVRAHFIRGWACLLILTAAIFPYLASLGFTFVYDDDIQVLANPAIRSWISVPGYFLKPIPGIVVRYYRPIFFLWFKLNYFLWNTRAWGWHLSNVVLHGLDSILVFLILGRYFKDRRLATVGALVFAVHPVHIETVAWVSGCTDSLMAIGLLGSLLLWMKNRETPMAAYRIGSQLCCGVALLTKETAIILPALIWLHALAGIPAGSWEQGAIGKRLRVAFWEAAPYAAVTTVYLAVRSLALTGVSGTPNWVSRTQNLLTAPSLLLFYLRHVFLPVKLSIFYDFPIVDRAGSYLFWVPLLVLAALTAGACLWLLSSGYRVILIAGCWILFPVAPVLYIRMFRPDDFVHDRYLYLPVLGLSILAGILCESFWKRASAEKASFLPAAVIGLGVLSLALATAVQAEAWKSNLSLYTHAIQVAPKNTMARNNLAGEYATEGRYQEATDVLRTVLRDRPGMWLANYNYGCINYRLGNLAVAEDYLRRAISIDAGDADQYMYLGATYFKEGRLTEAAEQLRHAIVGRPDGKGYHFTLAMIELQLGNVSEARLEMQIELKYHAENARQVAQAQAMLEQLTKGAR